LSAGANGPGACLRDQRKAGEVLDRIVRHQGGRPKPSHDGRVSKLPNDINNNQSSRWQTIARIPEET
jgi:hypothetical protein